MREDAKAGETPSGPIAVPQPASVACPICRGDGATFREAPNWGTWRRCSRCGHEFVHPLRSEEDVRELFDAAYSGQETRSEMGDFAERVKQREIIKGEPSLWFWTPAFDEILTWLKRRTSAGSTVLEVGSGLGFFLHAMRDQGFEPVGLDVAKEVVELNRKDGFEVWHGTVESTPTDWASPEAVVALFMFHHVVDPVGLLATIRERWPSVPLAMAQYGPSQTAFEQALSRSMPPRTLHRWHSHDLAEALTAAGYTPEVRDLSSSVVDSPLLAPVRTVQKHLLRVPWAYRFGKRVKRKAVAQLPGSRAHDSYTLLAFAEPTAVGGNDSA